MNIPHSPKVPKISPTVLNTLHGTEHTLYRVDFNILWKYNMKSMFEPVKMRSELAETREMELFSNKLAILSLVTAVSLNSSVIILGRLVFRGILVVNRLLRIFWPAIFKPGDNFCDWLVDWQLKLLSAFDFAYSGCDIGHWNYDIGFWTSDVGLWNSVVGLCQNSQEKDFHISIWSRSATSRPRW